MQAALEAVCVAGRAQTWALVPKQQPCDCIASVALSLKWHFGI